MYQMEIIIDKSISVITEKDSLAFFDLLKNFINSISDNMKLIVEPEKKDWHKPYIRIFDDHHTYYYIEWSGNTVTKTPHQYSTIVCNRFFYKKGEPTIQQTPVTLLRKHAKELFRYANEYKGIRNMLK